MLESRRDFVVPLVFVAFVLVGAGCANPFSSSAGPVEKRAQFEEIYPQAPVVFSAEFEPHLLSVDPWGWDGSSQELATAVLYSSPATNDFLRVCFTEITEDRCGAPFNGARVKFDEIEGYDIYQLFPDDTGVEASAELTGLTWEAR